MTAIVEVRVEDDRRAFIEAGSIAGIVTSPGGRADVVATKENPLAVILRGGATLNVYGESASMLLLRSAKVRQEVKAHGFHIKCDLLDGPQTESEADDDRLALSSN